MQSLHQALEIKVEAKTALNKLYDLSSLEDLSSRSLIEGAKIDRDFLTHLNQFQRLTFVSDKFWSENLVSMIEPLLPRI